MEPYVGMKIYGYCEGYFGRDSFNEKIIEAIGPDWVVAREIEYEYGEPLIALFKDRKELLGCLSKWVVKGDDET